MRRPAGMLSSRMMESCCANGGIGRAGSHVAPAIAMLLEVRVIQRSMDQVRLAIERYADALEAGRSLRAGIRSVDAIAELTGGGVTMAGVEAIAEYLAECRAIETGTAAKAAFKGPWQREICQHIANNTYSAIQAPRRLGKTYSVALWGTLYVAAGYRVILALPTMRAGSRLIFRQITDNIGRLALAFPALTKRVIDQPSQGEVLWENAGQTICLSSDKDANVEGYGCEYLIIDEAHRTMLERVAVFQPFTDDAVEQGIGRVTLLGIGGGAKTSALEGTKYLHEESNEEGGVDLSTLATYQHLRYRADDMVHDFPQLKPRFDRAKATMTQQDYDEQYNTEPGGEGTDKIFQTAIPAEAEWNKTVHGARYFAGIDPGKRKDDSVLVLLQVAPSAIAFDQPRLAMNVVARIRPPRGMPYTQQAEFYREQLELAKIPAQNVTVETNGVGEGLADIMAELMPGINYYWASEWFNNYLTGQLQDAARHNTFGIPDAALRREIGELYCTRTARDDGTTRTEWQHNDSFSAIRAALYGVAA